MLEKDQLSGNRGNTVVTGQFRDTVDFDPSDGLMAHTSYGGTDVFLVKLSGNGEYVWSRTIGGDQPGTGDGGQLVDVGPYGDPPAECDTGCPRFDFSANDALDLSDFAAFHAHLTGPR